GDSQRRDLSLLFRGNPQFVIRLIRQAAFEHREHLLCASAGGADDENVAETGFVVAIAFGEAIPDRVAGRPDARLLLAGPTCVTRPARPTRPTRLSYLPNPRVRAKGLQPIVRTERRPDAIGGRQHVVDGSERSGGSHH